MSERIGQVDESSWFFQTFVKKRVTWGFVAGALFLVFADPTRESVFWGFWIALLGELVRTWASGTIVKNEQLTTEGPYGLVRNPLYLGNFLIGLGVAVMGGRWWFPVLLAAFFLPVYGALIRKEEKRLLARYGDAFLRYCERVPRFVPRRLPGAQDRARYDARRMWSVHREWRAWLGLYGVTLYLLLRA